jgi:hypothetical protein
LPPRQRRDVRAAFMTELSLTAELCEALLERRRKLGREIIERSTQLGIAYREWETTELQFQQKRSELAAQIRAMRAYTRAPLAEVS